MNNYACLVQPGISNIALTENETRAKRDSELPTRHLRENSLEIRPAIRAIASFSNPSRSLLIKTFFWFILALHPTPPSIICHHFISLCSTCSLISPIPFHSRAKLPVFLYIRLASSLKLSPVAKPRCSSASQPCSHLQLWPAVAARQPGHARAPTSPERSHSAAHHKHPVKTESERRGAGSAAILRCMKRLRDITRKSGL